MSEPPGKLFSLLHDVEDEHLEFKAAENSYSFDKLLEYCCALANERGGKLILGVTDKRPRLIVGTKAFTDTGRTCTGILDVLRIKVDVDEIIQSDKRVLIFNIPSRPIGMPLQVKGSYWMRSGESLVPMPPGTLKSIFDEASPDYSAEFCNAASIDDLDSASIERFRELWLRKSGNAALSALTPLELLSDAELVFDGKITYAALVLFGTKQALGQHLAQAETIFEYRSSDASGPPAQRFELRQGFLPTLDQLWSSINLRNDIQSFQDGLVMFDIPTFNERAVREAILNSVVHRDYRLAGSIFIRQYPRRLEIVSPGGFPDGITEANALWRQLPRNRRIAEAVARCGLVERSGQGLNRMYEECIKESKPLPDFSGTDVFQVSVTMHGDIQDEHFFKVLEKIGTERLESFTTREFLVLDIIRREQRVPKDLRSAIPNLLKQGVVEPAGGGKYMLSRALYNYLGQSGAYTRIRGLDRDTNKALLVKHIAESTRGGSKLEELLQVLPSLSRRQVQRLLNELRETEVIHSQNRTSAARWHLGPGPR